MSIFDNIGKKVSETAKTAAKRSGDIVEATKLNISIATEEDKIKRVYSEIGKVIYKSYAAGEEVPQSVKEYCDKIKSIEKNIEDMKQKILELRDVKACPECKTELHVDMAYCHKCGAKQEISERKAEEEKSKETDDVDNKAEEKTKDDSSKEEKAKKEEKED